MTRDYLMWRLYAPMVSYGEIAVGEQRPTAAYPGKSLIVGLLSACLGISRTNQDAQNAMAPGYGVAVLQLSGGFPMRDYHTAQAPSRSDLKGRPHATRKDELNAVPTRDLQTILSDRDYRLDAMSVVAVWAREGAPHRLDDLRNALERPVFTPYIGRRACPVALPFQPMIIEGANSLEMAFEAEFLKFEAGLGRNAGQSAGARLGRRLPRVDANAWLVCDADEAGPDADTYIRHDQPAHRGRWQFAPRREARIEWRPPSVREDVT